MYISVSFNRSFFPLPPLSRPSNTVNSSLNPHDARPSSQRLLISTNFSPFLRRKFPKCRFILQIFQRYSFPRKRKHPNPRREKNLLPTINLSRSEIQSLPSCTPFLKFPSLRHAFSPRFLTIVRDFSASSRVSSHSARLSAASIDNLVSRSSVRTRHRKYFKIFDSRPTSAPLFHAPREVVSFFASFILDRPPLCAISHEPATFLVFLNGQHLDHVLGIFKQKESLRLESTKFCSTDITCPLEHACTLAQRKNTRTLVSYRASYSKFTNEIAHLTEFFLQLRAFQS